MSVKLNSPFAGTMVPMKYYMKEERVSSVMVEVNRRLYMDEATGEKGPDFEKIKAVIHSLIRELSEFISKRN